ncbi:MAG: DUF5011 domain-containing protein, partial [Nitrosopumilus sp.]|nr:DUF5011 domain-containing protein [Nitrosopumilus sp.]
DTTAPSIEVIGPDARVLEGRQYSDMGARCLDDVDGPVPAVVTGFPNTAVPGTYTVSYTCADEAGNESDGSRTVTVVDDTTRPVITITGGLTVNWPAGTPYVDQNATCSDGGLDLAVGSSVSVPDEPGTYTVGYTCVDPARNRADAQRTVHVLDEVPVDRTPPLLTLERPLTVFLAVGTEYVEPGFTCTDETGGTIGAAPPDPPPTDKPGTFRLTYECEDGGGNLASSNARSVTERLVLVAGPPDLRLTGPPFHNVEQGSAYVDPGATCTAQGSALDVTETGSVDTSVPGIYELGYSCRDRLGQVSSAGRTVYVHEDGRAPRVILDGRASLDHVAGVPYVDAGASCTGTDSDPAPSGGVNWIIPGPYNVTYTCSDQHGNSASASRSVTVVDADGDRPVILQKGSTVTYHQRATTYTDAGAICTDAVDGEIDVTSNADMIDGNSIGSQKVTYRCSDEAGNEATSNRTVIVQEEVFGDFSAPHRVVVIGGADTSVPVGDVYVDAGAYCEDRAFSGSEVGRIEIVTSHVSRTDGAEMAVRGVDTSEIGTYRVVYDCADPAGNLASSVIGVADRSRTVTVKGDIGIALRGPASDTTLLGVPYPDPGAACLPSMQDADMRGTIDHETPGNYTILYVCSDSLGRSATASRTVEVVDDEPPEVTILGENPFFHPKDAVYDDDHATCEDRQEGEIGEVTAISRVDPFIAGNYTVTYTCADSVGNEGSRNRTVVVVETDFDKPILTPLPGPSTVTRLAEYDDPGATCVDAVLGALEYEATKLDTSAVGTGSIIYTCSDIFDNEARAERQVEVIEDAGVPVITRNGGAIHYHLNGTAYDDLGATCTDEGRELGVRTGGGQGMDVTNRVVDDAVGIYNVTYACTDLIHQVAKNRTVHVVRELPDRTALYPDAEDRYPAVTVLGDDPATVQQNAPYVDQGATCRDPLGGEVDVVTFSMYGGGSLLSSGVDTSVAPGDYEVWYDCGVDPSYRAQDSPASDRTWIRGLEVIDSVPPEVVITGDNPYLLHVNTTYADPGATCTESAALTTSGADMVDERTYGMYNVTYTCTDAAENQASKNRTVVVGDHEEPVITILGGDKAVEVGSTYRDDGATCRDGVDGDLATYYLMDGRRAASHGIDTSVRGPQNVTYGCTDDYGNNATAVRVVSVGDVTPPRVEVTGGDRTLPLYTAYVEAGARCI